MSDNVINEKQILETLKFPLMTELILMVNLR